MPSTRYAAHILAGLVVGGLAACAAIASLESPGGAGTATQEALAQLRLGQYERAETNALAVAENPDGSPRAWAIVASARQARGQYASAARAYKMFLATCENPQTRQFVLDQLDACQAAAARSGSLTPSTPAKSAHLRGETRPPGQGGKRHGHRVQPALHRHRSQRGAGQAAGRRGRGGACSGYRARCSAGRSTHTAFRSKCGRIIMIMSPTPATCRTGLAAPARWRAATARRSGRYPSPSGTRTATSRPRCWITCCRTNCVTWWCGEFFGDATCPLLLNEGLAMLAEAEPAGERVLLAGAALAGKEKVQLEGLLVKQRQDIADNPEMFYAQAYSFASFLSQRLTPGQFAAFLSCVKEGCSVADSLQRAVYALADDDFIPALTAAWADEAVTEAQYLRALRGEQSLVE